MIYQFSMADYKFDGIKVGAKKCRLLLQEQS